jgi:hypothetical protein
MISLKNVSGSRRRYDANFKMMVINHAEVTNNCAAGHDLEQSAIQYVREKRNEAFPITWEVIHTKALELSREMPTPANTGKFKAGTG